MSTEITSEFVWHSIPPRPRDSPKGRANSSVKKKICIVVPKPLSRVKVTFQNMVNSSSDVQ